MSTPVFFDSITRSAVNLVRNRNDTFEPDRNTEFLARRTFGHRGTIVTHGVVVPTIIGELRRDLKRGWLGVRLSKNLTIVSGTTLLLLAGHILEIAP